MGKRHVEALRARAAKIVRRAEKAYDDARLEAADLLLEADMLEKKGEKIRPQDKTELENRADLYAQEDAAEVVAEPEKGR